MRSAVIGGLLAQPPFLPAAADPARWFQSFFLCERVLGR
jgi:hypothetical protein